MKIGSLSLAYDYKKNVSPNPFYCKNHTFTLVAQVLSVEAGSGFLPERRQPHGFASNCTIITVQLSYYYRLIITREKLSLSKNKTLARFPQVLRGLPERRQPHVHAAIYSIFPKPINPVRVSFKEELFAVSQPR